MKFLLIIAGFVIVMALRTLSAYENGLLTDTHKQPLSHPRNEREPAEMIAEVWNIDLGDVK